MNASDDKQGTAWQRFTRAVRYVLNLEPVYVASVWRALVVLAGAIGITVGADLDGRVTAGIAAAYVLFDLLQARVTRKSTAPQAAVVEQIDSDSGLVVAGPANELATGTQIRELGHAPGTSAGGSIYPQ